MNKILVPTDFSAQAYNALKAAAGIARKSNAEIILLHIIDLPQETMDMIKPGYDLPEIMFFKQHAEARLSEISLSQDLNGLTVSQILKLGRTFDEVTTVAKDQNIDLIVMGSHGASGFKELFIGSNTEKVIRTSEIPVLAIKGDQAEVKFDKVIVANDFTEEVKQNFQKIINFLKSNGGTPHFLMVNTPNNFKPTHVAEEMAHDFLKQFQLENYQFSIYNDLDIEKGILNFAERENADLIAMGTHGRKGFARFLNGSISEDLMNHSPRSIITFKL
ncbi:universal stress protein [Flavobacterium sp. xlx-214]|uniref:universal stress protein n=1 Tax=unclassified Flavobacterium TaxID=196869 RepID=UPI0013D1D18E|nr:MULTISPECIES: universal stress protein [unclassified Flavobacterium]MBA5793308.1 universal stress protein [Flavobacterium sp. xlx-221]QMI84128.1 universal stress protein [Flavobacterium sp. xlx-214]